MSEASLVLSVPPVKWVSQAPRVSEEIRGTSVLRGLWAQRDPRALLARWVPKDRPAPRVSSIYVWTAMEMVTPIGSR